MSNKMEVPISGMHCRSCELLIEGSLSEISGVENVSVNYKKGLAELKYGEKKPSISEIENAIRKAGYEIGNRKQKPFFSRSIEDYKDLGIAFFVLVVIYFILKNLGLTNINIASPPVGGTNPSSLSIVFLVGITAGLSTCMALVGGLILGISARHAEKHPEASTMQKFRPHLFFNLGRIGGYAFLGGILGWLGSALQLSGGFLGVLTIIVGVVMLMLGMKLVGIFPRMENGGLALPKSVSKFFGIKKHHEKEYSHKSSMITGALTFFLPCGFTQAMQLYAISTGSFSRGFLIMGLFALGTAPGLLGIGGLSSVVKGIFAKRFFKFAGILVIFLAFFNIANGYNLTGWANPITSSQQSVASKNIDDPNVTLENGVQIVKMTESSRGYSPNKFTIKKGIPVRWVIDAKDQYSCASSIMISKLGIRKSLKAGENVIEFTPSETGNLPFSCSMGMYTGMFSVVDDQGNGASSKNVDSAPVTTSGGTCGASKTTAPSTGSCGGSGGGCGGCGGGKPVVPSQGSVQSSNSDSTTSASEQIINTTYTYNDDVQPNIFKVKVGQPVKFVVDVKENGLGCMSTITIPGLTNDVYNLTAGKKIEMSFTPTKKGVFNITCAMGVPRGTITVE